MADEYADALIRLEDEVARAVNRANDVLSDQEIAKELRRIADELDPRP